MPKIKNYNLWDHQAKAKRAILANIGVSGKVILPTGAGKTRIQSEIAYEVSVTESEAKRTRPSVIVMLSPRLVLNSQHIESHWKNIARCIYNDSGENKNFRFLTVQSDYLDSNLMYNYVRDYKQGNVKRQLSHHLTTTTSADAIADEYRKAKRDNQNLIIICTYHSAERIHMADIPVDEVVCDESQYMVRSDFNQVHAFWDCPYHFYTATEIYTDSEDGFGMNNTDLFGETIFSLGYKPLIERFIVVEPNVCVLSATSHNEMDEFKDYAAMIHKAMELESEDLDYDPKILCVFSEKKYIEEVRKHLLANEDRDYTNFAITSDSDRGGEGSGCFIDNQRISSRDRFYERMHDHEGKAIIMHIDILGEGIDLHGISSVIFFHLPGSRDHPTRGTAKILQNIGRAMRLHTDDMKLVLEDTSIDPLTDDRIKKNHCKVIIPYIVDNDKHDASSVMDKLRMIKEAMMSKEIAVSDYVSFINPNDGRILPDAPPQNDILSGDNRVGYEEIDDYEWHKDPRFTREIRVWNVDGSQASAEVIEDARAAFIHEEKEKTRQLKEKVNSGNLSRKEAMLRAIESL